MEVTQKTNFFTKKDHFHDTILHMLVVIEQQGYAARLVGGIVRDFLANNCSSTVDVDIATTATAKDIRNIADKYNMRIVAIAEQYGTVSLVYNNIFFEITSLRKDVRNFGRKAQVEFIDNFYEDSLRRDFTINAMYLDKYGVLYDYHGGIQDLAASKVRFIGDPVQRINEDFLRILRFFRFTGHYGDGNIDASLLDIINASADGLCLISGERIINEMLKILAVSHWRTVVKHMQFILNSLFLISEIKYMFSALDELTPIEKLAFLLRHSGYSSVELRKRYRLSNSVMQLISLSLVDLDQIKLAIKKTPVSLRKFYVIYIINANLHLLTEDEAHDLLRNLKEYCSSEFAVFSFSIKHIPNDLIASLSKQEIGRLMKDVRYFWLSAAYVSTSDCIKFACNWIKEYS